MLQRYDDKWKLQSRRDLSHAIAPVLVLNGIIAVLLIITALSIPSASEWISAAAQAEFVGEGFSQVMPTKVAQPAEAIQIVRNN